MEGEDEESEREKKIISEEADLFFASVQSENRILAVLADKFTDQVMLTFRDNPLEAPWNEGYYKAVDYERGIIVKSGNKYKNLIGKTIVLQRDHDNHVMKKEAEVSGIGVFGLDYMLAWSGSPIFHYVEELLKAQKQTIDYSLCELMLSQKLWNYGIMDLVMF